MYMEKSITTGYGFDANCWVINKVTIEYVVDQYIAEGNISLYFSESARLAGAKLLDNCRFKFFNLTEEELNGNTHLALYNRVMASVLNDENEETNIFSTSLSGVVSFQNATLIQ